MADSQSLLGQTFSHYRRKSLSSSQIKSKAKKTARPRLYTSSLNWLRPSESRQAISPSRIAFFTRNLTNALQSVSTRKIEIKTTALYVKQIAA
jgi:hypothetical protein